MQNNRKQRRIVMNIILFLLLTFLVFSSSAAEKSIKVTISSKVINVPVKLYETITNSDKQTFFGISDVVNAPKKYDIVILSKPEKLEIELLYESKISSLLGWDYRPKVKSVLYTNILGEPKIVDSNLFKDIIAVNKIEDDNILCHTFNLNWNFSNEYNCQTRLQAWIRWDYKVLKKDSTNVTIRLFECDFGLSSEEKRTLILYDDVNKYNFYLNYVKNNNP
jgi:hypothetical protein